MNRSSKTVLMLGVAVLALSACSGDKGPGDLGSKNDIVVRNHGEAPAPVQGGDFSTTVETAAAVPPAEVGQGEAVPPIENEATVDAATQSLAEQSAPVASTASAPINDSTPSAAPAPTEQRTPETPMPETPVTQEVATPQVQAEPYEQTRVQPQQMQQAPAVQTQVAPAVSQPAYPSQQAPVAEPIAQPDMPATAQQSAPVASPVSAPAPVVSVPKNPNAPFYEYVKAGDATGVATAQASAPATVSSGEVAKVKAALAAKGLYNGTQNDVIDSEFLNALAKYQGENGLPMGGVNAETKQHLGIAQ